MSFNILEDVKHLEDALKCQICRLLLSDPILIAKCGHSMCRKCFSEDSDKVCPICRMPVTTRDCIPDKQLDELLAEVLKVKKILEDDSGTSLSLSKKCINSNVSEQTPITNTKKIPKVPTVHLVRNSLSCDFSSVTPKVRRKKKMMLRARPLISTDETNAISTAPDAEHKIKSSPASSKKKELLHKTERLRKQTSDKNVVSLGASTPLKSPVNLEKKNPKGETLLHRTVIQGDLAKVKELIQEGARVNTQDNYGWTPLHEASNRGFLEMCKLLLDNGALVNVPSFKENIIPLHDALVNNHMPVAILLVSRGADMHAKNAEGHSAFDLCKTEEDRAVLVDACSPFISTVTMQVAQPKGEKDDKIVLLGSNLSDDQLVELQKFAGLVSAEIVTNFVPEVTHIVTVCDKSANCQRTLKLLFGILTGKWIINYEWIEVCLECKQKVDEEMFEVQGMKNHPNSQGPRRSRENMDKKCPPLFDGFHFYLHGPFSKPVPRREELLRLVQAGGGKVLSREPRESTVEHRLPYHAADTPLEDLSHIILYQEAPPRDQFIRRGHIATAHVMWFLECISRFKILDLADV